MVTVTMRNERPTAQDVGERINATLSCRMGVPMKYVPNVAVDVEYDYEDEGFRIRIIGVPAHHSERTGQTTVHARISSVVHSQVATLTRIARKARRNQTLHGIPLTYDVRSLDFLEAA